MPMIDHLLTYLRRHHVGLVALLLVLGGTAYAAASVGSRDVRDNDNSLRGIDVRADSLTGRDVAKGSIKAGDIAPSAIPTVTFSATVASRTGPAPRSSTPSASPRSSGPASASTS